jgi:hypothetical protein
VSKSAARKDRGGWTVSALALGGASVRRPESYRIPAALSNSGPTNREQRRWAGVASHRILRYGPISSRSPTGPSMTSAASHTHPLPLAAGPKYELWIGGRETPTVAGTSFSRTRERAREYADRIVLETGKPITAAEVELSQSAGVFDYYAGAAIA